jgi:hypothetical protein
MRIGHTSPNENTGRRPWRGVSDHTTPCPGGSTLQIEKLYGANSLMISMVVDMFSDFSRLER